ncbi:TetR/AcrR family transcriptional regulator [Clostridium guangxiense]|uniref:TetR/AcrR family transcriptional regulator n=1 Tax=Clostridium guangxiense TaxID=1662055 RepID=UPI001E350E83|nr:TetR/AcrR family transcriptional regulator [Clostridium guangxiense]
MEEKNFNEISVIDITRKAGVSRISYYRNYNLKEEIITDYIDETLQDFLQKLQSIEFDIYNNMRMFFESNRRNKQLIINLVRSNMCNLLFERYKNYFQ